MRNILGAVALLCAGAITAAAQPAPSPEALKDLAPTGKLRAAINVVNSVLAQRDPAGGDPKGISVDLSRELARRLSVPIELTVYNGAGTVFEAAKNNVWDVAYFAIEPVRSAEVDFTAPYVLIEGGYMVLKGSPVKAIADADQPGTRIAVGHGSVYDLYLTRTLKNAQLVRVKPAAITNIVDTFFADKLEVAAFIKLPLARYAAGNADVRMIDGAFMEIRQAMGTPKGRGEAGRRYLHAFVEEMKASGFVAEGLKRSGQGDAAVAPPAKE